MLAIVAVTLLCVAGCQRREPVAAAASPPRAVRVAPVTLGPATPDIELAGVLGGSAQLRLAFRNAGRLGRLPVQAGDRVRRGQWLAELDDVEAGSQLAQAEATLAQASREQQRAQRLAAEDVIPRAQAEDAATAERIARAQWTRAREQQAQRQLHAPADGLIEARLAEPGEIVGAGQPLLVLATRDGGGPVLRGEVADHQRLRLRAGQPASVEFAAAPGQRHAATLTRLAAQSDPRTGRYAVELTLNDTPAAQALPSGLIGLARLAAPGARSSRRVPLAALVEADGGRARLYVLAGERVREQAVRIAWLDEADAVLEAADDAGLDAGPEVGAAVVVEGAAWLHDGDAVRVTDR